MLLCPLQLNTRYVPFHQSSENSSSCYSHFTPYWLPVSSSHFLLFTFILYSAVNIPCNSHCATAPLNLLLYIPVHSWIQHNFFIINFKALQYLAHRLSAVISQHISLHMTFPPSLPSTIQSSTAYCNDSTLSCLMSLGPEAASYDTNMILPLFILLYSLDCPANWCFISNIKYCSLLDWK